MYTGETRVLLRHYLEQGVGKTGLARRFGISRRTIYHWIETGQLDRDLDSKAVAYGPRPPVPRKLDPYRGIIAARLEAYPLLTAQRLFEEIQAAGYPGGYTQVKAYVRQVRPRPAAEPIVRFETPAGFQGQVDFGCFNLPWGRRYALLVVLGYSRLLWLKFYRRQTMETLIRGLESAFEYFGGVPKELLFDQMRAVVLSDDRLSNGGLVLNTEFLRFAAHWGFRPRACRPYRAKTKGKVERPIRYLRQSFFYGRTFLNDEDLNAQVERWLEGKANVRRHRTLGESPRVRFERDERECLQPLALAPYPRLGTAPPGSSPIRPRCPIEVEHRPLRVYAEAAP
jgi:transposase